MRERPPENLVSLLENLRLAGPAEVAAVQRRARRLARGLPLFVSVWVDALVKVRLLTPFQAAEINAGRGEHLRAGPYVLFRKLHTLGFAEVYQVRHLETGALRRLATFRPSADEAAAVAERLERLAAASDSLPHEVIAPLEACGTDEERLWAVCDAPCGRSASQWMIYHGRFPSEAVLHIARRMMPGLVALEEAGLCHGDLRAATLLLDEDPDGKTVGPRLPFPGLRAVVRPREGYAEADLPPELFDGLAPERVRDAATPAVASDVYACGCLWWHLLTGRDPLPGGDGLTKLQVADRAAIADPRPSAPDTPKVLLDVIGACTQAAPERRPGSMAELATMLGPATPRGAVCLRRALPRDVMRRARRQMVIHRPRGARWTKVWLAAAAVCAVAATATLAWTLWPEGHPPSGKTNAHRRSTAPTDIPAIPDLRPDAIAAMEAATAATANDSTNKETTHPEDLVLPADQQRSPVARLPLRSGHRVHGPPGKRITLGVARRGLLVEVPGVVFENIDFVWEHAGELHENETRPAILLLRASGVELRGCTFRSTDAAVDAVRWIHPTDSRLSPLSLPNGRITVDRSVFRNVDAVVDGHTRGATAIRFSNVLHVGAGPLVRLNRAPGPDEPVILSLDRTTLRRSGPLVQCDSPDAGPVGRITIETSGCVLAPRSGQPLLVLCGERSPEELLRRIIWTGQGSLVTPNSPLVGRRDDSGQTQVLGEDVLSIDGLVRSDVEFAGEVDGPASGSQAVRWLAPLQSDDSPGIDASMFAE